MQNEKRQGKGVMVYKDGSVYDGAWEADNRHGTGTLRYPDSSFAEGLWEADSLVNCK